MDLVMNKSKGIIVFTLHKSASMFIHKQCELLTELSNQLWSTLPLPPKYVAPKPERPQAIFRNQTKVPLTLFWANPAGKERRQGIH